MIFVELERMLPRLAAVETSFSIKAFGGYTNLPPVSDAKNVIFDTEILHVIRTTRCAADKKAI